MRGFLRTAVRPPEWVLCAVFLAGTAFAAGPAAAVAPTAGPTEPGPTIAVSRADDSPNPPNGPTLRAAIEQASADPRDNVIRFDSSLFAAGPITIHIERPLVFAPGVASHSGHDRIDAAHQDVTVQAGPGVSSLLVVRQGELAIANLALAAGSLQTILVADDGHLQLTECRIVQSHGAGIAVTGHGQLDVTGGRIGEHKSHGIEAHDTSSLTVSSTVIDHNAQGGIALLDHASGTIDQCTIDANGQWGIVATNNSTARVVATVLRGAGFANLDAAGRSRLTLDACHILNGARFGILVSGGTRLTARRAAITANAWRGLELQNEAAVELIDSSVEQSGHFGVVLFGRSTLQIDGGAISRNRGHGLTIRDRSTADVRDCAFEENEYSGAGAPDAGDGGRLSIRRCVFHKNGLRPIFRGPLHIAPPVPTAVRIANHSTLVRAAPRATVDLYADRAGEAARYLHTVTADDSGQFTVDAASLPSGEVITAAATTADGQTSEFNVVGGRLDGTILAALLARTGPLSDTGGDIQPAVAIQRWRRGSHVIFRFEPRPPPHIETYVRWFVANLHDSLGDAIEVQAEFRSQAAQPRDAVIVPVQYASPKDHRVNGTGGTTFTQWDPLGYFDGPIRIVLANPAPGEDACPRVAIHEMCHALGLYHARVGLLSRMQGIPPPTTGLVNDFAPALTFFDVAALQILYGNTLRAPTTIAQLAEAGLIPLDASRRTAAASLSALPRDAGATPLSAGALSAPPASRR